MAALTLTPEAITALISDRNELSLRVVPGAKVEKAAIENGALKIWLRTAPEDGKATKAVMIMVAILTMFANFGVDITAVLGSLSVLGLALGLGSLPTLMDMGESTRSLAAGAEEDAAAAVAAAPLPTGPSVCAASDTDSASGLTRR